MSARKTSEVAVRVGFIGAGKMATAMARGLIAARFCPVENVVACDILPLACESFTRETGANHVADASAVVRASTIVILAVKPQQMPDVLASTRPLVSSQPLVISIAAGISLATLSAGLGPDARLVRVMPNTPCLVGEGASAFSLGGKASAADAALVERLLGTVGLAVPVPEKLLDAVTGLSGSGPAFVYQVIEALSDGGVRSGLPRDIATRLAAQTVLGSARMVLQTGEHPGALKDAVTSPGGTTIAGLHALERGGLRAALIDAVHAATQRSIELGKPG